MNRCSSLPHIGAYRVKWLDDNSGINRPDAKPNMYDSDGIYWFKSSLLSRSNGPAVLLYNGTIKFYICGTPHRDKGPAMQYPNGAKYYYRNGKEYHRSGHGSPIFSAY